MRQGERERERIKRKRDWREGSRGERLDRYIEGRDVGEILFGGVVCINFPPKKGIKA